MSKHTTLEQLKLLAQRTKGEISKVESKSLVGVKVNGVALAIADKMVDILIASGATNGTLSVAGKDVAVTGLAALAYKAQISEADLDTALKAVLDGKASGADLATLIGTDAGKSARTIANEELAALLEEAAARKGRHAAIRLNRPQAVLEVHFQEAPPAEACTAQEANEGEEEG